MIHSRSSIGGDVNGFAGSIPAWFGVRELPENSISYLIGGIEMRQIIIFFFCLLITVHCSLAMDVPRFLGEEVVVTAARLPQLKLESPWSVDVLNKDDLAGKTNLGEALRDVAGIDVKSSGYLGSVTTARLRGSTSQQVLILLDGRRINSPLLGMIDLGDILVDNVDKIEIARAPLSSLYGTDALGGVVNIITEKENRLLRVSCGTYNTQKIDLALGGTVIDLVRSDGFRRNSDYAAQNIIQNLNWDIESLGKVEAGLNYYNAEKGVPRVPDSESDPYSASTPNDRQKDQNLFANISLENNRGPLKTTGKVYYNQLNEQFHSYNFFSSIFEDTEYKTQQQILELNQDLELSKRSNLSYGLELKQDRGQSQYAGDHTTNNYAAFGQFQLGGKSFNLVIGSRFDKHSVFGNTTSPRAGLSFYPSKDLTVRASIGNAFKAPTLNDLYWNDPIWQMYGNTSLSPEKSQSYELGIENNCLSFNYYGASITDLILWDWDLLTNITRAKNVGAVAVHGAELEYKHHLTSSIDLFANYTWEKSEDVKDINPAYMGKRTPYSPEIKYSVGVKVLDNIKIMTSYVGERYADGGNTIKLPEYTTVGAWAGYDFGKYRLSLSIDNLFNQVYYETVGYHPTTYAQLKYPMPGRTITISIGGQI